MNLKETFNNLRSLWRSAKQRSFTEGWRAEDLRNDDDLRGGAALVNAYEQSVWVHACIHTLAANVAQVPFRFSRGARKGEDLITTGPLVELFNHPHPQLTRFAFWELYVSWLCLRGEVFVVPMQVSRQERRLHVLSPDQFQQVIDDHELIGWRYTGFGPQAPLESQVFLPDEVIHDKIPNPFHTWRGVSPLNVAMLAAQTDYASAQFMKGAMLNNADAGVVACMDDQLSQRHQSRARPRFPGLPVGQHRLRAKESSARSSRGHEAHFQSGNSGARLSGASPEGRAARWKGRQRDECFCDARRDEQS